MAKIPKNLKLDDLHIDIVFTDQVASCSFNVWYWGKVWWSRAPKKRFIKMFPIVMDGDWYWVIGDWYAVWNIYRSVNILISDGSDLNTVYSGDTEFKWMFNYSHLTGFMADERSIAYPYKMFDDNPAKYDHAKVKADLMESIKNSLHNFLSLNFINQLATRWVWVGVKTEGVERWSFTNESDNLETLPPISK